MPRLDFKGKTFVQNHHLAVPFHQLVPNANKGLTRKPSLNDNLIVNGDNLLALKALLPTYAGRVKCIYIDPPYNTGNEGWAYNDRVNSPMMKEWLGKVVGGEGEDLTRHDKWLCMMLPRLKLLRELLTEDGAIFISIDDNEQHNLRTLMDEIFGDQNFVASIVWQKKYSPQNDARHFSAMHEYVVAYARSIDKWQRNLMPRTAKQDDAYKNPDNDSRGPWKPSDLTRAEHRDRDYYVITTPSGKEVLPAKGRSWSRPVDEIKRLREDNRLWFGTRGDSIPSLKRFLSEVKEGVVPVTLWFQDDVGSTDSAMKELKSIFDGNGQIETPKPSTLIRRVIQLATDPNDIILDSFAGSGTTAHAVLAANKEDGGNRKFVLVEMEDYADKITAERVRRVIKGVPDSRNDLLRQGLGGTFSYFTLGKAIETESLLSGKHLPSYEELARYVFYTATGEDFDPFKLNEIKHFAGSSSYHDVYVYYKPDLEYLKSTALTLDEARRLRKEVGDRPLLVFAPTKYIEQTELDNLKISFCQLPFEIYKLKV